MPVGIARAALRQSMNVTYLVSMEPPGLGFLLILMPTTGTEQYLKLSDHGNQTLRTLMPLHRYKTAIEDKNITALLKLSFDEIEFEGPKMSF
nr:Biomphalaria glabrata phosphorylase b kinase regulatory subunit beta-like [Biomphalaria glabrata]